jgi:hypothetical protein
MNMQVILIALGLIVVILGIAKHFTKHTIGYQLVSLPGYIVVIVGLAVAIIGVVLG